MLQQQCEKGSTIKPFDLDSILEDSSPRWLNNRQGDADDQKTIDQEGGTLKYCRDIVILVRTYTDGKTRDEDGRSFYHKCTLKVCVFPALLCTDDELR